MHCYIDCADQIPIVDDELKKAAGDEKEEDIQMIQGIVQKLVTADGTYASQSAFSAALPVKKDQVRFVIFLGVINCASLFLTQETLQCFFSWEFVVKWLCAYFLFLVLSLHICNPAKTLLVSCIVLLTKIADRTPRICITSSCTTAEFYIFFWNVQVKLHSSRNYYLVF